MQRRPTPHRTHLRTLLAALIAVFAAACAPGMDDETPVQPEIAVDAEATHVYVDRDETAYYEGSRVLVYVVPVDTAGRLIASEVPVEVIPSSGAMDPGIDMNFGTIRGFGFVPDERAETVSFSVIVNGTPVAAHPEVRIVPPCSVEQRDETVLAFELAEAYAPVLFQDTGRNPRADFIAAFDFDGDWNAFNNWNNLDRHPLTATVYYALSETRTHYFLFYGFYYPRRSGTFTDNRIESVENDLSGILLAIRKDGSPLGALEVMETLADGQFYQYTNSPGVSRGTEWLDGGFPVEDGTHPRVFLASRSHGAVVSAPRVFGEYLGEDGGDFPGGDGVVYAYAGVAEEPLDGNDRGVGYALVPLLETLWAHREEIGDGMPFVGAFEFAPDCVVPEAFGGDDYRDGGGTAPWMLDDPDDEGIAAGEWFLNPAKAVGSHVTLPEPYSRQYVYNPYLGIF